MVCRDDRVCHGMIVCVMSVTCGRLLLLLLSKGCKSCHGSGLRRKRGMEDVRDGGNVGGKVSGRREEERDGGCDGVKGTRDNVRVGG